MAHTAARLALFLLAWGGACVAQETPPAPNPPAKDLREETLQHIRGLAAKIEDLHDASAKISGFARLGEIVCKEDPELARSVFTKAYELTRARLKEKAQEEPPVTPPGMGPRQVETDRTWELLLSQVARCDADLAYRFNQQAEKDAEVPRNASQTAADLRVAAQISSDDPEKAAQFAGRALGGRISEEDLRTLIYILFAMRDAETKKGEVRQADAVFLRALANLAAEPRADTARLLTLGNYLFGPQEDNAGHAAASSMGWTMVGNVSVPSIMGTRPWTTPAMARQYLETCLNILARPSDDARQRQLDYAGAFQMRVKARELAPNLAPLFEGLLGKLLAEVPQNVPQQTETRLQSTMAAKASDMMEEYEKTQDPQARARILTSILHLQIQRGELEAARKITADIEDVTARDAYLALIDFMEIARGLDKDEASEPVRFREVVSRLKEPLMRSLLWAGWSVRLAKEGDPAAALQAAFAAQRDAEQVEPRLLPWLSFALAGITVDLEATSSLNSLERGVGGVNALEGQPSDNIRPVSGPRVPQFMRPPTNPYVGFSSGAFSMLIQMGEGMNTFGLRINGAQDFSLTADLLRKFSKQAESVEPILMGLSNETRRADALASLAAAYLERLAAARKKPEPPAP